MKKNRYFLDTSYSIALAVKADQFHKRAVAVSLKLEREECEIFTTQAIQFEIGNSLSKQKYRASGVGALKQLESDTRILVVSITPELFEGGQCLFFERPDKEWSLVDCISFIVMQEHEITSALTTDAHFIQAGFRALLRED